MFKFGHILATNRKFTCCQLFHVSASKENLSIMWVSQVYRSKHVHSKTHIVRPICAWLSRFYRLPEKRLNFDTYLVVNVIFALFHIMCYIREILNNGKHTFDYVLALKFLVIFDKNILEIASLFFWTIKEWDKITEKLKNFQKTFDFYTFS